MASRIDTDVLRVLSGISCEGDSAKIVQQLDRKMYLKVNKVLEALGGKWNRKAKAHVFESFDSSEDAVAATIIGDAVSAGEYVDPKSEYQFFETPPELADLLIEDADIMPGMSVLEPSAGRGAIAKRLRNLGVSGVTVECVEINQKMAEALESDGFVVFDGDFLQREPPRPGYLKEAGKEKRWHDERFDRVVMNPPFTRSQDIAHVRHAFEWLKPGGRLVSVMGAGWTFREDRKARDFRDFLQDNEGRCEDLPPGTFSGSGTNVHTNYVVVDKPFD